MMTDPISDMLTRIRNANLSQKETLDVPSSKIKLDILKILEARGFIDSYSQIEDTKQGLIRIRLKFTPKGGKVIHHLKRISTPSRRTYVQATDIVPTHGGIGITIISTSQGVMTTEDAKRHNVGGELICEIW